ncbi:MAG: diaminopimelate decarboxylase [Clostridia bacterium]|nr:diaminopimelate decarboxylase [Clostridia bacterium]
MNTRETLKVNNLNHLEIAGVDAVDLAKKYSTPLYVFDVNHIEKMCKTYADTLNKYYGNGKIFYASKAFCCKQIYRIISKFGLGSDAVSLGEMYTSKKVNKTLKNVILHGNNKSKTEIEYAIKNSIGYIVIDSTEDLVQIDQTAKKYKKIQNVLIRVNPGIEAHTHKFIQTATVDSKFGFSIDNGDALDIIKNTIEYKNVKLLGLHCHIGSQIFEEKGFLLALEKMTQFYANVKNQLNYEFSVINMGGGLGIWYSDDDKKMTYTDYENFVKNICETLKENIKKLNLPSLYLMLEPGRSIVGEAGVTLYTVGSIKQIKGVKNYLAIDGGMFENPRYALYQAKYTAVALEKMNDTPTINYSLAGKCCESGDIITENSILPIMKQGDLVGVLSTGAYNYSMASNYNRNLVPKVVGVKDGKSFVMVKGQTLKDIIKNDK